MRKLQSCLLFFLAICLLLPLRSARAEGESAGERGLAAIRTTRNWDYIQLPRDESYLDTWKTLYGRRAWYAPSLYVESIPMVNSGAPYRPFLFEGTEVTVVAEENDMSCILYRGENHRLYAGWIQSIRLLEEFPGPVYSIGTQPEGEFETLHEVALDWSHCYLPQTEQPYTVLPEPVENCAGFTLEYQIIAENTPLKDKIWGDRTVWISDGENWTPLGVFPYWENGAVQVRVRLPEGRTVAAIATVAHCDAPNIFDFRQTAKDFLIAK